ncbi:MAG: excinuclease ABC subunit UvrC [Pseudomonadota bacterium]|jgi:excinuclease ABC subunit C
MTEAFDGKAVAQALGAGPGVYRMLDDQGAVLYVGKASSLRKRVGSYFSRPQLQPRLMAMVSRIAAIETTVTRTEAEALLLENELIKSLKPRYNVLLRDDKSYPWIHLATDQEFPRLGFHRGARGRAGRYFGPFPSAHAVRESIDLLQKLFRVRQCEDSFFRGRSRPCLQHQIGRCTAPCVGLINHEEYARDVRHTAMFLDGRSTTVTGELAAEMDAASRALDFERAALLRDQIATLKQVQARQFVSTAEQEADVLGCAVGDGMACVHALFFRNGVSLGGRSFFPRAPADADATTVLGAFVSQHYIEHPAPHLVLLSHPIEDNELLSAALSERRGGRVELRHAQRGERARLVEMALRNAMQAIATQKLSRDTIEARWNSLATLLGLETPPARIECFDVSHIRGEATVASCVVFDRSGPVKAQYRRYNIDGVAPGDDYGAMRQALQRRFRRAQKEHGPIPDLLLIDGGRGQLAQAEAVLSELAVQGVAVVGVAKGPDRRPGLEELVLGGPSGRALRPREDDPGLHLVQWVRDEAHRFAITGHRARRQKTRDTSTLEGIAGIGVRRRSLLLRHFGGLAGVQGAGVEELAAVPGIDRALAARIYQALHG